MAKPCTTLIGGKEYNKNELMAAIAKGEFDGLLGKKTNKALSSVEETAKALEGLPSETIRDLGDGGDLTRFRETLSSQDKKDWDRLMQLEFDKNANKKEVQKLRDKFKPLEQAYFSGNYPTAKKVSEAYHRAKADGSNPELVKAVEDLLTQPKADGAKETKPEVSKQAEPESKQASEGMVGKTVTFEHAGSEKSGVVKVQDAKGNLEVEGVGANKGVKYTVKEKDVISEISAEETQLRKQAEEESAKSEEKIKSVIDKAVKKNQDTKRQNDNIKKSVVGSQQVADVPNRLFQNWLANKARKFEDKLAKYIQKASISQNSAARNIADFVTSFSRGIMDTQEYAENKRVKLTGGINKAKQDAEDLHGQLWDLIGGNVDSADRVHQVLDPELRQTGLKYDDLTDSEKDLHDLLRSINDYTHNQNFLLGKISKETYDKYRGKYIGREYNFDKDYEQTIGGKSLREILGIYKQRKDVDADKILASIKDPIYLSLRRYMQTGQNRAISEYANWIKRNNPELVSNTEKEGFHYLGNGYGELSNKWVARNVAEDFKGFVFNNEFVQLAYDVNKAYDGLPPRQFMKELLTVFNPQVQLGNWTSNMVFAWLGGVDAPTYLSKSLEARREIKNRGTVFRQLQQEGLLGTDFTSTDLKPMQSFLGEPKKDGIFRKFEKGARGLYGGVDDAAKIQMYLSLKDMGYSHKEASQTIFEAMQNYQNTGRIWDFASKTPIIGNSFVKFTPEMLRLLKNGMTRRPLHTLAFISMMATMPKLIGKQFGEDDDEIDAAARAKGIPKIMIPYTDLSIPLSWRLGDKRVNLARFLLPMYLYDIGGESRKATEFVNKFIPYQLKETETGGVTPFNVQDPLVAPILSVIMNKDFRDKPIVEETDDAADATFKKLRYIARGYGGFYANMIDDIFSTSITGEDYYGRRKTATDIALNTLIKVETFDDARLKEGIVREFDGYERLGNKVYMEFSKKRKQLIGEIDQIKADKALSKERKEELIAKKKERISEVSENVLEDIADIQEQALEATEYYNNLSRKADYKSLRTNFSEASSALKKIFNRIDVRSRIGGGK